MRLINLPLRHVDYKTELTAGFSTFLAMLYIIPVNAAILSQAGMPHDALISATILMTVLATALTALWANVPVAMSVGMGLNAYFAFGLVKGMGLSWQTALGVVFLSGLLYLLISFTPLRRWMIETIPLHLKRAVSAGIGAFIAFIGMVQSGWIVANKATLVSLGNLKDPHALMALLSFLLALFFRLRGYRAAFILAIFITSALAWVLHLAPPPQNIVGTPASLSPLLGRLDISSALSLSLFPVVLTFLLTDIFDTMGTLTGVGLRAGLFDSQEGEKALQRTVEADATATLLSALAGVSTTTAFIESAAGVEAGGRTGWSALFTALFFALTFILFPLFSAIPGFAVYPVLILVGISMFSEIRHIDFDDPAVSAGSFFMIVGMPLTYSITDGLLLGSLVYVAGRLFQKAPRQIEKALWLFAACALLLFFVL